MKLPRAALALLLLLPAVSRGAESYADLVKDFDKKQPARGVMSVPNAKEIETKLYDFAAKNPDKEEAVDALGKILQVGRLLPNEKRAAELLVSKYARNDKIIDIVKSLRGYWTPARADFLRGIVDKAEGNTRDYAAYRLIQQLKYLAQLHIEKTEDGRVRAFIYPDTDAMVDIERANLKKLVAEADKLNDILAKSEFKPDGKTSLKEAAESLMAGFRNLPKLVVGAVAPDAEGVNLEGKKMKLSDFRGKVVVVDIWATWCGPCRAMIPHERELVKHLEGKPFVFLSISGDKEKEALTKFLKKTPMPWEHWWNGQGGMMQTWNIRYFPTIYVLDAKGVIRFKGVRGAAMDKAVETLLAEMGVKVEKKKEEDKPEEKPKAPKF